MIFLAGLGVGVVSDFKGCAVGGETAVETRAYAGTEVAADASGAHQANLRFDFSEQVDKNRSVRVGCIGIQFFVGNLVNYIGTIGENLIFYTVELVADDNCFELDTKTVGEHSAFCKQLKADVCDFAFVKFAIYYEVVIVCHSFNDNNWKKGCFSRWYD